MSAQAIAESPLHVGSTIWYFDINNRVYPPRIHGEINGGPIYREHWRSVVITGETRVSWISHYGKKAPKRGSHPGWAFTLAEVDDDCWVHGNRGQLTNEVMRCGDAEALRKIAAILGWESAK